MNKRHMAFSQGIIKGVLANKYLTPGEKSANDPEFNLGFVFGCLCYNQQLTESYFNAIKNAGRLANYYDLNLQDTLEYAVLYSEQPFIKYFLKGYFYQKGALK
ncbi:hypothetical protein [Vagococcus sp. WN89Y]|uniref:hypothetical protein n=1 Tax=Vagococcus sp. WN89Y TaxID=3457258 RepID=UPI003FCDF541